MGKKLTKKVPELRFPEFERDWRRYKVSQLFTISAGGDIDINKVRAEPDEVYKHPVYANAEKNKGLYGYSNEFKIEPNVITVAGRGVNIGIAHARDHCFYPIVRLLVLKPKATLNIYFFEYQINRMNIFVESTGVPQLTAPQISSYKFFSTSIAEQEKIANFLGAVDARLTQLRRKRDRLQTYKRGVMQKLFSQQICFKQDDGSPFPSWQKKKLNKLGDFKNGFNADKQAFGTGVSFVNLMDIFGRSEIKKKELDRVQVGSKQLEEYKIQKGDVLFVRSSVKREGVGQACLVSDDFEDTIYSGFIIRFRSQSNELYHSYKKYCFSSPKFRRNLLSLATSSANTNINQESLSNIDLSYPCREEQKKNLTF